MKLLLIEDEARLAEDIVAYLGSEGIRCTVAESLEAARGACALYSFDIVLLDVGLPDGSGLELIRGLVNNDPTPGILVVSAKNSLDDKLTGLDLGADDYITKPFHLAELHARIRSVFRRKKMGGRHSIPFEEIEVFPEPRQVTIHGKSLHLSPKEFDLLLYFVCNPGKVLTREAIAEHLWGEEADHLDDFDFIYSHVKNLRRKIVKLGGEDRIKAVYGIGYKFLS